MIWSGFFWSDGWVGRVAVRKQGLWCTVEDGSTAIISGEKYGDLDWIDYKYVASTTYHE